MVLQVDDGVTVKECEVNLRTTRSSRGDISEISQRLVLAPGCELNTDGTSIIHQAEGFPVDIALVVRTADSQSYWQRDLNSANTVVFPDSGLNAQGIPVDPNVATSFASGMTTINIGLNVDPGGTGDSRLLYDQINVPTNDGKGIEIPGVTPGTEMIKLGLFTRVHGVDGYVAPDTDVQPPSGGGEEPEEPEEPDDDWDDDDDDWG
ncbi:MAG: hypothetical protein Kow002_03490 [Anaerolineales bacterium]